MKPQSIWLGLLIAAIAVTVYIFSKSKEDAASLDVYLPDNAETAAVEEQSATIPTVEKKPSVKPTAKQASYTDLPEPVQDTFTEEEWAYIAPAIDKALAAGERKKYIDWATPSGITGTAYQSGTGTDEDGCRQIRITTDAKVTYIEKCANGQFK